MDSHHVIIKPLHTEKSVSDIRANNTYHFRVAAAATKSQVKHALEQLFPGRKVMDVRTLWVRGKQRRVRRVVGSTSTWKKAIVRLRAGDAIDIGY
jgi:large subunit ribosomal protein L23